MRARELEFELARAAAVVKDEADIARELVERTASALDEQLVSGEIRKTLDRALDCVKRSDDGDVEASAVHAILRAQARRMAAYVDLRAKLKQAEFHRLEGERTAVLRMLEASEVLA